MFNDDSENSEEETSKMNKKQALFESEQEDDEDFGWDEKKLAAKDKLGSKVTFCSVPTCLKNKNMNQKILFLF